jgi:prophage antirepressor-like protein
METKANNRSTKEGPTIDRIKNYLNGVGRKCKSRAVFSPERLARKYHTSAEYFKIALEEGWFMKFDRNFYGVTVNKFDDEKAKKVLIKARERRKYGTKQSKHEEVQRNEAGENLSGINEFLSTFTREGETVRAMRGDDGKELFVATDVARILGYEKPRGAIDRHCSDARIEGIPTKGGTQEVRMITFEQVVTLVNKAPRSRPEVKAVQDWIEHEVIPQIVNNGYYDHEEYKERKSKENGCGHSTLESRSKAIFITTRAILEDRYGLKTSITEEGEIHVVIYGRDYFFRPDAGLHDKSLASHVGRWRNSTREVGYPYKDLHNVMNKIFNSLKNGKPSKEMPHPYKEGTHEVAVPQNVEHLKNYSTEDLLEEMQIREDFEDVLNIKVIMSILRERGAIGFIDYPTVSYKRLEI